MELAAGRDRLGVGDVPRRWLVARRKLLDVTERVAYIAEAFEFDDRGPIATGLFSCEARAAADDAWLGEYAELPLPLAEALVWGRSRGDRVSVRIAGASSYSAGSVAGEDPPLDESQLLVRRRAPEWEFLDRSESDPPIWWDVVVDVDTPSAARIASAGERTELGERWRVALEHAESCQVVEVIVTGVDDHVRVPGRTWTMAAATPVAVLRVQAGGYHGAIDAASAAVAHAASTSRWEPPAPVFSVQHAFATDSQPARRNAHVTAKRPGPSRNH